MSGQQAQSMGNISVKQNQEFNRFMADMTAELELLFHNLLGEEYNQQDNNWVKTGDSVTNKAGAHALTSDVRTRINKNTFISNLTDKQINRFMVNYGRGLSDMIFFNQDDYEIKPENMSVIFNKFYDFVFIALHRCKDAGEREYYGATNVNVSKTDISKGGSITDYIPFIGGRRDQQRF